MEQKLFFAILPQEIPLKTAAIPVPRAGVTGPIRCQSDPSQTFSLEAVAQITGGEDTEMCGRQATSQEQRPRAGPL